MSITLEKELEINKTMWSNYYKTVDLCGKDSKYAISRLKDCIEYGIKLENKHLNGE